MAEIQKFIEKINVGNNMHSVLMMRGDEIMFEGYWKPYSKDSRQRMYSEAKSLVGIAIGMLEYEGKLSLDDKLYTYFEDKIDRTLPELLKEQTIRDNLMMSTAVSYPSWFTATDRDRVHLYFNGSETVRVPGTIFTYDSTGSQVLGCLVQRLAGMPVLDYLREKAGLFKNAKMLQTPTGEPWYDSSLLCTLREMAEFGRFVMTGCQDKNGNPTVSEEFLKAATGKLISTDNTGFFAYNSLGYGYQIWHLLNDDFCFFGMGNQLTICVPSRDFLFACTADDQGYGEAQRVIIDALYEHIINKLDEPTDTGYAPDLSLKHAEGEPYSDIVSAINNVKFAAEDNPMCIKWFCLSFGDNKLDVTYENATGIKKITAGACFNIFDKFPEEGYSKEIGGEREPGHKYDAAFSYAFRSANNLLIQCRIIDEYLGNLSMLFGFSKDGATVRLVKAAENFLQEYQGVMIAKRLS